MDDGMAAYEGPVFDIRRYAPPASSFTKGQHEEARRHGFADAVDHWVDRMTYRQWVDWRESVAWRAKQQFKQDLASVGLDGSAFDALGRAWRGVTAQGGGAQRDEERHLRDNLPARLAEIQNRLEEMGASLDMDDSEVQAKDRGEFNQIKEELCSVAERLRAADVDGALRTAANSSRPEPGDALPEMKEYVSPDPELRRIYDAYHAEVAAYEAQHAAIHGLNTDGSSWARELPNRPEDLSEDVRWDGDEEIIEADENDDDRGGFFHDEGEC
jgi:hypothetical protein